MISALFLQRLARFFFTPAGKFLAVILALVLWTMYHRADATADCRDKYAAEEIAEAN